MTEDWRWEAAQVAVHDGSRSFLCSEMNFRQFILGNSDGI